MHLKYHTSCMPFDDDSDPQASSSSSTYFESPTKAKRDALQQKLAKQGLASLSQNPGAGDLKGLKLQVLKQQVEGKKDEEKKRDQGVKDKQTPSSGTKTREQEIASERNPDPKPSAEQAVKQSAKDKKANEELQKNEVQGEGG